jgi:RsiW-degrading membrane proteinase PrsW (M82 family)
MANKPRKSIMPEIPVPRDHADASTSELMPFRSKNINLLKSPLFMMFAIAGAASVMMFGLGGSILANPNQQGFAQYQLFIMLTVFVILFMIQVVIYASARTTRPIWPFMIAYAVTVVQMVTPIFNVWDFLFRKLLPGSINMTAQTTFIQAFIGMWFGAGMCEELLKAVPILLGAWLTVQAVNKPEWRSKVWFKLLQVRGPLDGVLMGAFSGAAFIMVETATGYVPSTALQTANESGYGTGLAAGLLLLVPRVVGGASHIAYSMIFGYFIGLGVIRPRQFWKLIGIGYLSSALIHTLWNSVGTISPLLYWVISIGGAVLAGAALLKARHLEVRELGGEDFTSGSILVEPGRVRAGAAPASPPRPAPMPAPPAAPPAPVPPAPRGRAAEGPLSLDVDGVMIPLRGGGKLDLGAEPALAGRGVGVSGEIVPHPTKAKVLGLRNTGAAPWTARLRDGSQQMVEKGQNIRLAAGVQIDFGAALAGRVVAG